MFDGSTAVMAVLGGGAQASSFKLRIEGIAFTKLVFGVEVQDRRGK